MSKQAAIEYLTQRYEKQCERFPRTKEIPLSLYIRRNLRAAMKLEA